MPTIKRIRKGVVGVCTVAACVATAAVLAQPQPRAFDIPGEPGAPGWGGVVDGSTLFLRAVDPVTMSARNVEGVMVKAASLPHNVHVVQGIASKTMLQIDHEQWGRSTVELELPVTAEVWLDVSFDDVGRAHVNILNATQLRSAVDARPAWRVSLQGCGDCDVPHETPGCTDTDCEALVCAQDTFCCVVEWDQFCVNMALAKCDCDINGLDCGTCTPSVNDGQVGITGTFIQQCESDQWVSLAFPVQTGGADVDTVLSVHNTNTGEGDIYIMGGTCDGPDVTQILATCCCAIVNAPSGVEISNTFAGGPFATSDVDPTWVVLVFRSSFSFDVAFDSSTLGTAGAAYGNLTGSGDPGEWQDLNNFNFGACYFVDLVLTGDDPSICDCEPDPEPPANDDCEDAIAVDVEPGGTACIDGTTILATVDDAECVTPTTAGGVWYTVTGTGNGMRATTCEDFPPAGADYDTKISVFCGDCPEPGSNCCTAHGGLGCDDVECESIVCAQDSFCCATAWDSICQAQALSKCEICMGARQLICVDGNDDACTTSALHSTVEWCSQAGAEYLILVHGFSNGTGNFTLCVSDDGVGCPFPVVCIPDGLTGACCQCDGPVLFCTQETEEDCLTLTGDPVNFLGIGVPCFDPGEMLSYVELPALSVPDGNGEFVCHTIDVAETGTTVFDVDVDVVFTHCWVADLVIKVQHNGLEAVLWNQVCGSGDDLNVIFDDEGNVVECGAPTTGNITPQSCNGDPLSIFDGQDAGGPWTICVSDNAPADVGTLDQWSLHIQTPGVSTCDEAFPDKCFEGDDDDDDDDGGDDDDDGAGWWGD